MLSRTFYDDGKQDRISFPSLYTLELLPNLKYHAEKQKISDDRMNGNQNRVRLNNISLKMPR